MANLCDILELDGYAVTGAARLKKQRRGIPGRISPSSCSIADCPTQCRYFAASDSRGGPECRLDCDYRLRRSGRDDRSAAIRSRRLFAQPINPDLLRTAVARVLKMQEMEQRTLQAERLAAIGQMIAVLSHESGNALALSQVVLANLAVEVRDRPAPSISSGNCKKPRTICTAFMAKCETMRRPSNWNSCLGMSAPSGGKLGRK